MGTINRAREEWRERERERERRRRRMGEAKREKKGGGAGEWGVEEGVYGEQHSVNPQL